MFNEYLICCSDAPNVTIIHRGNRIDSTTVNEGEEIVIECSVRANPVTKIVQFLHNGIQLVSDSQAGNVKLSLKEVSIFSLNIFITFKGIIANNSSLVITSARSIHKGNYQCLAINSQGKGISQQIKVNVQCKYVSNSFSINFNYFNFSR